MRPVREQFADLLGDFDEVRTYAHRLANDEADVERADLEYLAGACAKLHGEMLVLLARMRWAGNRGTAP